MYFHGSDQQILKQAFMVKRSQCKSKVIKTPNYKERVFELTPKELRYYDGNLEKKGKLKGTVYLGSVKVVEFLNDGVLERPFGFQVQYDDWVLYIFASCDDERQAWVQIIRDEVSRDNKYLLQHYHPGAFVNNCWTCCKEKSKQTLGCQDSYFSTATVDINGGKKKLRVTEMPLPPVPVENNCSSKDNALPKVVALYDYKAVQDGDLSLTKGEEYLILEKDQQYWWFAKDSRGKVGYIPRNYVSPCGGVESEIWFHGDLSRQETDQLLPAEGKDGAFLVRKSSQPGMYTLSLCFQGQVKHYHLKKDEDNMYHVSHRHRFETVNELVVYHQLNSAGLVTRLKYPYTKSGMAPVAPGLGHNIFEIPKSELKILKELGRGQFGTVYEGRWRGTRQVAVKKIKQGAMSEEDFIEEAKVMEQFKHKNLVMLFGICSCEGPIFIVTELLTNGSLLDFIRSNVQIGEKIDVLLGMIFNVSSAMAYLEQNRFIHRDLAARNCLVNERKLVKVADFGLARYVLDDEYTASEGTKFPVKWAAPEVVSYSRFSSKSDVWSYGILCWEVFSCGRIPYVSLSNQEIATMVTTGKHLEKPGPRCPHYVYELMEHCWAMDPDNRPSFADIETKVVNMIEEQT